ncbi:hypothetical protein EDB80DRAFT_699395 [Ilyonectria destructans]|nr:hypothetical protein EDB80DRAFT_699395 [Ilyonectria destructans]
MQRLTLRAAVSSPTMLARLAVTARRFGITAVHQAGLGKAVPTTEHKPNPTESEEDVRADRSRVEPLRKPRPTESEEDIRADRSAEDPIHNEGKGKPAAGKP